MYLNKPILLLLHSVIFMQSAQYVQVPQYPCVNQQPCVVVPLDNYQQQTIPTLTKTKKLSFDWWMFILGFLFILPWFIEFRHIFTDDANKRIFATRSLCGFLFYSFLVVFILTLV